ncbi:MAG: HEAT repeat domain-containing protein [Thermoanaerobaculia bacterium]
MNLRKLFAALGAVILIGTAGASTYAYPAYPAPADERAEREADLYDDGMDDIDEGHWDEAVRTFARVAEMKGTRADGALYWTAYALNKMGRTAEALQTVEGLKKAHPKSKWLDDAQALELELRHSRGEKVKPENVEDEELKAMAINSLMHTDPEKAYPLLEKIVRGNGSKKLRERAIFILSQSSSPRAQALLFDIARGNANPDLQRVAVRHLGMSGNAQSRKVLSELYASTASTSVKKEVLRAFMIGGDEAPVVAAARGEKDPSLRKEAIRTLGVMNARAELVSLYGSESARDVREAIIEALFVAGDVDKLSELARGEKDAELRKEAIQKLGVSGGKKAGDTLIAMYDSETDEDVREAILNGLFLQGNSKALIGIAKKEKNKSLKKRALQKLSHMGDDEALEYMLQILNEE